MLLTFGRGDVTNIVIMSELRQQGNSPHAWLDVAVEGGLMVEASTHNAPKTFIPAEPLDVEVDILHNDRVISTTKARKSTTTIRLTSGDNRVVARARSAKGVGWGRVHHVRR